MTFTVQPKMFPTL